MAYMSYEGMNKFYMSDLIIKHGGYKNLKSFQNAEIVYDFTFEFVRKYVQYYKDREQMEGAARGGKQNIAEGSQTSGTSKKSEIRLVDVARASQEELKLDYEDFLRKHKFSKWDKNDPRTIVIRQLAYKPNRTYKTYTAYLNDPESAANCMLCLINQTTYLLDQQIKSLQKELQSQGDFKERYSRSKNLKNIMLNQQDDERKYYEEMLKQMGLVRLVNGQCITKQEWEKLGKPEVL